MRKYALWFFRQMSAVRGRLLLRIIAGLLQVALGLWLVWLCRRFIDVVIWRGNVLRETIVLFSVIALLIALRQLVFYLSGITEVILQNDMRSRLFRFVLGRKLYAVKHQAEAGSGKPASDMLSGDISQRLERDLSSASSVVTDILPTIVVTLVQLFGAFFLMRSIDSILAWSLLVLTPVVAVCAKYLGSRLKKMTLAIREEESSIQMMIQETVEHELTIKTLQAESTVSGRVGCMQQRLHHLVRRRIRFTLISRLLLAFTFSYGYFGAFVYGAIQLKNGLITFGVMTAFLQLVGQIQSPIMSLLGMIPQLIHASASVDRLVEIENTEQEESLSQADASIPLQRACGIRLQDVSYSYPDERKKVVVSHFSYDFRPATSVAIVGETGCGKTTILRLLSSIIQPDSGRIVLYDALGKESEGTGMRSHIVYIEQGNTLMSGTIRDNLLLANPVATDEQLTEAEMRGIMNATAGKEFDFVFSHTCPISWEPRDLFIGGIDQSMVDKTMEVWMDKLKDNFTWKCWCFGHYHADRIERPCVEQFYNDYEDLENIWNRWYDKETYCLEWWLPKSPYMEWWDLEHEKK